MCSPTPNAGKKTSSSTAKHKKQTTQAKVQVTAARAEQARLACPKCKTAAVCSLTRALMCARENTNHPKSKKRKLFAEKFSLPMNKILPGRKERHDAAFGTLSAVRTTYRVVAAVAAVEVPGNRTRKLAKWRDARLVGKFSLAEGLRTG